MNLFSEPRKETILLAMAYGDLFDKILLAHTIGRTQLNVTISQKVLPRC